MIPFHLVETTTEDKLIHQGVFYKPSEPKKHAILWIHGLASTFYSNIPLLEEFARSCEILGFGFASFNNRGHDIVTGVKRLDYRKPKGYSRIGGGAGVEKFKDSLFDIDAGISFLVKNGFREVVVVGHSSGANKACYYAASKKDPRLIGVVLAGPASDRLDPSLNTLKLKNDLAIMRDMINKGKGDSLVSDVFIFPTTPRRFLSAFEPNTLEDQFDYGDPRPRMRHVSKIKKPMLVILGEKDEYLDRASNSVIKVFDEHQKSSQYKSVVIKNALHSFNGHEDVFVKTVIDWTKSL